MTDVHDDPLREAASAIVGLGSELANVVMATQSLQLRLIGLKPDKDAPLEDLAEEVTAEVSTPHLRVQQAGARFDWQPALNDDWLAQASPVAAARAWAAAVPFADQEPSAALAVSRAEVRLAEIHPEAMANYHQLRAEGLGPAEAMIECAPAFDLPSPSNQLSRDPLAVSANLAPRASARAQLTHDVGLDDSLGLGIEHPAALGPEHPISLNLHQPSHHSAAASASHDPLLDAQEPGLRSGFEGDDGPDLGADLEAAPAMALASGEGPEHTLQDELGLSGPGGQPGLSDSPTLEPSAIQPTAGPDGPPLSTGGPQSEAAKAAEISMRTFPDAHLAAERTPQIQPAARPQKRKTLSKVLKPRGRR